MTSWLEDPAEPTFIADRESSDKQSVSVDGARWPFTRAAAEHLLAQGLTVAARGLDLDSGFYESARSHKDAFYDTAGDGNARDHLIDDLVTAVLHPHRSALTATTADAVHSVVRQARGGPEQGALLHAVRDVAVDQFSKTLADDMIDLQMVIWGLRRKGPYSGGRRKSPGKGAALPNAEDRLRGLYDHLLGLLEAAVESFLEAWDAAPAHGFDTRSIARVLTALLEGLVIQAKLDPEDVTEELFGSVVEALIPALLRPRSIDVESLTTPNWFTEDGERHRLEQFVDPRRLVKAKDSIRSETFSEVIHKRNLTILDVAKKAEYSAKTVQDVLGGDVADFLGRGAVGIVDDLAAGVAASLPGSHTGIEDGRELIERLDAAVGRLRQHDRCLLLAALRHIHVSVDLTPIIDRFPDHLSVVSSEALKATLRWYLQRRLDPDGAAEPSESEATTPVGAEMLLLALGGEHERQPE